MKRSIHSPMAIMVLLMAVSGCSDVGSPERSAVDPSIRTLAWTPTAPSTVDTGSGVAFIPRVAVEPDGGGTAFAVWVEYVDINPFDLKPKVYHIYARRYSGGGWAGADAGSGCVAGGFNGPDDGVCLLDSGSLDYDAFGPRISMDNNGDAMVVWQQANASDCDGATVGVQTCTSVYGRNYTAGGSWSAATIIDSGNTPASSPDIAMEPDGGGTAMAVWSQKVNSGPTWSTACDAGQGCTSSTIRAVAEYAGRLYAAETGGTDAAPTGGRIIVYNDRAGTWTTSFNAAAAGHESANALYVYCSPHKTSIQENCRLYAGVGGTALGDGDVYMFDGTSWTRVFNQGGIGNDDYFISSFTELNGFLYAAGGGAAGSDSGYIYGCDPGQGGGSAALCDSDTDWFAVYNVADGEVLSIAGYSGHLYAGLNRPAGKTVDVTFCTPWLNDAGDVTDVYCETGEWGTGYQLPGGAYESTYALTVFNGVLYAGAGGTAAGDGDIFYCVPENTDAAAGESGTNGACVQASNWTTSFSPAGFESIRSLSANVAEDLFFAGMGDSAGDGDIYQCTPTATFTRTFPNGGPVTYRVCDTGDWTLAHDPGGAYETIRSLGKFNGFVFAGGGNGAGDGDVFKREAYDDFQIMTRRFDAGGGGWAATDAASGCPGIQRGNDGVCELDAAMDHSVTPIVGMDNAGQATVAYLRFLSSDCSRSAYLVGTDVVVDGATDDSDTTWLYVPCFEDRVFVDRFDGTDWLGAYDISPIESLGTETAVLETDFTNTNCEDTGFNNLESGEPEGMNRANACLDIGDVDLAMNTAGDVTVSFKTFEWVVTTEDPGGGRTNHDAFDLASNQDIRVFARSLGSAQGWFPANWTQSNLAAYEWTTDGSTLDTSTCASVRALDDNTGAYSSSNLQIMNCNLMSATVAVEPDPADNDGGSPDDALGSAMVAYERYNGTDWQVIVHRCVDTNGNGNCGDAGEWGTIADADNCANPNGSSAVGNCWDTVDNNVDSARAPQISMDSLGNAMLVWAEPDGAGDWRVYGRRFCPSILAGLTDCGAAGWGGIATLNAPLVGEAYFEPVIAMEALNGGNANSVGDAFSLFSALDTALTLFRIDSSAWTP